MAMAFEFPMAHSREQGPTPVNPQEKAFFDYLTRVANIRFGDRLQVEPWFTCVDRKDETTFFSASLFQFTSNTTIDQNVKAWVSTFMDHAYWASINSADCTYDINQFNECFAKGSFRVYFRDQRVVYFYEGSDQKWCND